MDLFFKITFLFSFGFLFSQNDTITKPFKLKEVIIDAAHIKSTKKDLPFAVTQKTFNFSQKNLKQESLDEYLEGVPGLFSQNANNFAQDLRLSIRGFGARSAFGIRGIKLIVDGIPETTPDGQGQVDNIPLGIIENVTILRGPASALYGNSSGGVIQIKTASNFDKNFIRFRMQGGSFGYSLAQFIAGWKNDKTNILIFQNLTHSNGFREFSSSKQGIFNAKISHEFSDKSKFNFQFNYTNSPYAYDPGGLNLEEVNKDYNQARQRNIDFDTFESIKHIKAGLNWKKKLSSKMILGTYFFSAYRGFEGKLPFEYGGFINLKRNYFGFGTNIEYSPKASHFLQLRLSVSDQKDNRKRYKNLLGEKGENTLSQKELFYNSSISLLDQIKFDYGLLRIAVRYDHQKIKAKPDYEIYNEKENAIKLNVLNPSIGFTFNKFRNQSIYGSFATSFETPTLSELSANPNDQAGFNKSLESSL
ncbi:MAG: TonB-dependent receptor, partial [Flavobacteriaceae bacterium]|nr:TonB-dependent receptor [Flavobacteriaceae bacterium]